MLDISTRRAAFAHHAQRGERVVSFDGGPVIPLVPCSGCGRTLEPPLAFTPVGGLAPAKKKDSAEVGEDENTDPRFCVDCRASLLGPACRGCGAPTSRSDGIVAVNSHWHKQCLRCSHEECRALLGERYFAHESMPYCRTHYLEIAGEKCAACGEVVDGGLRALGRVWHEGCLRCAESDEPLPPGEAFLHEGRPVAPASREQAAPRCAACGTPALSKRVYARGAVYHHDCFKCVHCRVVIGERKFVVFDSEPYLEACYQKLFGASAGEAMRAQLHGALRRYAIHVPLQLSLGSPGLERFRTTHEELLPIVRRLLREHGIVQLTSFLFAPPAVNKPSLLLQMQIPATLQAEEALPQLLQADRTGLQWEQLIASVHDTAASRSNPWWATITPEMGAGTADEQTFAVGDGE